MKWISWFQPTDDHRPLSYPPSACVLGWWCTGSSDRGATMVALISTDSEETAKQIVQKDWPEAEEWRFCEDTDSHEVSSRYPIQEWMAERGVKHKNE